MLKLTSGYVNLSYSGLPAKFMVSSKKGLAFSFHHAVLSSTIDYDKQGNPDRSIHSG